MNYKSLSTLEYDKITEKLASYAGCEAAKQAALGL